MKNTAFIRGMFSSALEARVQLACVLTHRLAQVAKFEGASIRTVSGVRGGFSVLRTCHPTQARSSAPSHKEPSQVPGAERTLWSRMAFLALALARAGSFRATFEDKILMSDIVFCRSAPGPAPLMQPLATTEPGPQSSP